MLTYNLENRGKTPIYMYLYQCIKQDIISGKITANKKLPSKRELAEHLKISNLSVQNAYGQLLSEGYIYSLERKGYFIGETNFVAKNAILQGSNFTKEIKDNYEVDFSENSISFDKFPFSVWSRQLREVLSENAEISLAKIPSAGVRTLRQAIAKMLYETRGMNVHYEQIFIGAGSQFFYSMLVKLFGNDSIYAVENPGYQNISKVYEIEKVICKHIPLDNSGLDVEKLAKSEANIVHISPNHHFPTGIVMPIKRRMELLKWANESENRYIIEDDYDSEFRYVGKLIPTLQSIDTHSKVIYMNTFTKTISPAIRISFLVLPTLLAQKYDKILGFYSCSVSSFEQLALAKFIDKGYFEQHINRMRKIYKSKRNAIIEIIKQIFGKQVEILEKDAGLHFIMKLFTEKSDEVVVSLANNCGIKITPIGSFYSEKIGIANNFIVNYSAVDLEKAKFALENLQKLI